MQYHIYTIVLLMSYLASYAMELKEILYKPHDLLIYGRDNNISLPKQYDEILDKDSIVARHYKTLNHYGFCVSPNDPISNSFVADITEHSKSHTKTHVLEIGCGMGLLAKKVFLSSTMDNDFKYTAMDLNKDHLTIATQEVQKNVFTDYLSQVWYPVQVQFPDVTLKKTFTHIGAFNVHHFFTPQECIQSLKKIESLLDEHGTAYIYTMHPKTRLYGSLIPFAYGIRSLYKDYPGYIKDMPKIIKKGKKVGLISQEDITHSDINKQAVSHCLFLRTEELGSLIKKHTNLTIQRLCTIDEYQGNKRLSYAAAIVTKLKQL